MLKNKIKLAKLTTLFLKDRNSKKQVQKSKSYFRFRNNENQ